MRPAVLAMAATAAMALAIAPSSTLAASGTVTGTLIDDEGEGVAGLTVGACGPSGCVPSPVESDRDGHYVLSVPAGSGWNVFAGDCRHWAFSHKFGVNVADGRTVTVDLRMTREWGAISGHVVDPNGAPVAGVGLLVDNAETGGFGMGFTTSAADGSYTASCLAAGGVAGSGSYFITAAPPAGSAYGGQQDAGIAVVPDHTTAHDVVLRKAGGTIAGHVRCNGGPCPAGGSVLIYCEGCSSSANAVLDQSGAYALGRLAGGQKYDVHAVGPAGWDNEVHYGVVVRDGAQTIIDFNLVAGGPATSGRLTGRVTDGAQGAHGQCLINAFGGVPGTSAGGWTDGDVHTGDDGRYDSGFVLAPGDYRIFIVCPGWPQVELNNGRPVSVQPGSATNADQVLGPAMQPAAATPAQTAASTQAYVAAGSTAFTADLRSAETIAVHNPGAAQALTATYLFAGAPPLIRSYALAAGATTAINVNAEVGANKEVSVVLAANQPFSAARSMLVQTSDGINSGLSSGVAAEAHSEWFFAEGDTMPGFDQRLVLLNPNQAPVDVTLVYALDGGRAKTVWHRVPALSRLAISVGDAAEAGGGYPSVATSVFSSLPIVAERQTVYHFGPHRGVATAVGASPLATDASLAAQQVGNGADVYLALFNPDDDDATVRVTYAGGDGNLITQTVVVPGSRRTTIHVNEVLPAAGPYAISIQADLPIAAERVSYGVTAS